MEYERIALDHLTILVFLKVCRLYVKLPKEKKTDLSGSRGTARSASAFALDLCVDWGIEPGDQAVDGEDDVDFSWEPSLGEKTCKPLLNHPNILMTQCPQIMKFAKAQIGPRGIIGRALTCGEDIPPLRSNRTTRCHRKRVITCRVDTPPLRFGSRMRAGHIPGRDFPQQNSTIQPFPIRKTPGKVYFLGNL